MVTQEFEQRTRQLIDSLKAICAAYGLGNDGNEFKIITQVFLYKFLNDKFTFEAKKIRPELSQALTWEQAMAGLGADELEMLQLQLGPDTPRLKPEHFLAHLFSRQNEPEFAKLFDDTLRDIAITNNDIFAVKTDGGAKVTLFDRVSEYISDPSKRDNFCRALINKLVEFSFERIFTQKYDFYAALFEYLIKDYNKDSGGKYAEYYTPHAVAKIMAAILVPKNVRGKIRNVSCYDPSAGSGTLLMNIAHAIGEQRCSIYSQDISQKSSSLLRLNLILNNLVHSIPNVIQGNTMLHPYHREGKELKKFDFIVSNPPFKMDFSDFRIELDSKEHQERFFAGVPNIPNRPSTRWPFTSCSCSTSFILSSQVAKQLW
ncbi:N-6 DNA methylase [Pseudomonas sp. PCH446]